MGDKTDEVSSERQRLVFIELLRSHFGCSTVRGVSSKDLKALRRLWNKTKTIIKKEMSTSKSSYDCIRVPQVVGSQLMEPLTSKYQESNDYRIRDWNYEDHVENDADEYENESSGCDRNDVGDSERYTTITPQVSTVMPQLNSGKMRLPVFEGRLLDMERQRHALKLQLLQKKERRDLQEHLQRMKTSRAKEYYLKTWAAQISK